MKHKFLSFSILLASLIGVVGCGQNEIKCLVSDAEINRATTIGDTFMFDDEHLATDTVHKGISNFSRSQMVMFENGRSEYRIVMDKSNPFVNKSVNYFVKLINDATGVFLPIIDINDVEEIHESDKYFIFGVDTFESVIPSKSIIDTYGFGIKTIGNSIFITAYEATGIENAVRRLLNALVGYEALSGDLVYFEIDGKAVNKSSVIYLPLLDIVEKPDYQYRVTGQTISAEDKTKLNVVHLRDVYVMIGNGSYHNSQQILPPETYKKDHPDWYSDSSNPEMVGKQMCYTAHGNKDELALMVKTAGDFIVNQYLLDTTKKVAVFGQMDFETHCTCTSCREVYEKYQNPNTQKKAHSALLILFNNMLDDYIKNEKGINDLQLQFFAYQESMTAPYDPTGELHTNPDCGVLVAPSRASYTHSFYDKMQENMENDYPRICREWANFTDSIYLWYYQTQFKSVLYPFQTFQTTVDNCRFGHEIGGQMVYPEGDEFNDTQVAFGEFKNYLYAKGSYNVNEKYSDLKRNYFDHYFGSAGKEMETLYDQMVSYLTYLATKEQDVYKGLITHPGYDNRTWWNKRLLIQWKDMALNALKTIEQDKKMNPEMYETYKAHVEAEAIFPYLALSTLFANEFSNEEIFEIRSQLATWCRKLGVNYFSEADKAINSDLEKKYFNTWGV